MKVGASATAAIEWASGDAADPDLHNPMVCIRSWLRVCDGIDMQAEAVSLAWSTRLAEIRHATQHGHDIWQIIMSSMSYLWF